jgi:hypothetical protein
MVMVSDRPRTRKRGKSVLHSGEGIDVRYVESVSESRQVFWQTTELIKDRFSFFYKFDAGDKELGETDTAAVNRLLTTVCEWVQLGYTVIPECSHSSNDAKTTEIKITLSPHTYDRVSEFATSEEYGYRYIKNRRSSEDEFNLKKVVSDLMNYTISYIPPTIPVITVDDARSHLKAYFGNKLSARIPIRQITAAMIRACSYQRSLRLLEELTNKRWEGEDTRPLLSTHCSKEGARVKIGGRDCTHVVINRL